MLNEEPSGTAQGLKFQQRDNFWPEVGKHQTKFFAIAFIGSVVAFGYYRHVNDPKIIAAEVEYKASMLRIDGALAESDRRTKEANDNLAKASQNLRVIQADRVKRADDAIERARVKFGNALADQEGK